MCLESIYSNQPKRSFEVIVMDDASPDESAAIVRERFPQVRLFVNPRNVGYARSNNHAIGESRGRFVFLLNSDAQLLPGTLDALAEFLETHPEAGAAGSTLYNDDGTIQASVKAFPSAKSAFIGARSALSRWFPWLSRNQLLHWKTEKGQPFQADYVSSASIMIPRDVTLQTGPLDVRLWYFIDADYCKRIWNLGRPVYCIPAAKAIHLEHQGGTKANVKQRFRSLVQFHYGAYIFFHKHYGKGYFYPMRVLVILGLSARFVFSISLQIIKEILGTEGRVYNQRRREMPTRRES